MTTSYGAVIRLNEDGSVPDDNPDFGDGSLPELYSKGHRNPQGLTYDGARDILWETEHGARGGDEINIIKPGANYGWPIATYGIDYNGARITPFTEYEGTTQPFKYWTPSIAPSGLAVYRGDLFEGWDGDLLVGAMALTALHRVIMDGDKEVGEERYLVGERVRDVRIGPDGAIYVTTEDRGGEPVGKVLRLTPQ
jgi:glucose/arabinose dehydrogenase